MSNDEQPVSANTVPGSLAQVAITMRYTFLAYFRSRRFLILLIIGNGLKPGLHSQGFRHGHDVLETRRLVVAFQDAAHSSPRHLAPLSEGVGRHFQGAPPHLKR